MLEQRLEVQLFTAWFVHLWSGKDNLENIDLCNVELDLAAWPFPIEVSSI